MPVSASASAAARPAATRAFGRFELRRLLGRSQRTMLWLAFDPRVGQDMLLTLPRVAPPDAAALEGWLVTARQAARLNHPHLAHVVEVATHEQWPYILCDRVLGTTLAEWAPLQPPSPNDVAGWMSQALEGIAFAHEAGVAHHDVQIHTLLIDEQGHVRVMAFGAGAPAAAAGWGLSLDPAALRLHRDAAERDLLSIGILTHQLIAGAAPLDEPDPARVIELLPPHGHAVLALPWITPQPVPEALRVIVNRATDAQDKRRYRNARTLLRALEGWREAEAHDSGGPLAVLLDRLHSVGHLPALPSVSSMVVRLTRMERERTNEMAEQILLDMAVSFEMLRQVNSADVQGRQASGSGPVLTIRRAVAMVGLDGVRRAASALRAWPGPLSESGAAALHRLMQRVRLAGHLAQLLRPRGYDPEVIFLIAVMQNLGRLVVQYHFADDAEQIWQLMRPLAPATSDAAAQPGMSEEAASFAVFGTDISGMTNVVARHLGLSDDVLQMIRRLPLDKPVRSADGDGDLLRATASAANEVVDALTHLPVTRQAPAIEQIGKRYGRLLGIQPKDIHDALQIARQMLANGASPGAVDSAHMPIANAQSAGDSRL
jgi:hypothetical protein